ncbi:MAG TPA: SDR family NAD(P)-dependent oxidoreductase, partial [Gemmatimonadota bacterium]|nr:SDR family NAD(P)-dependent oxidoreductase [Gemmatimonadota bacterium]
MSKDKPRRGAGALRDRVALVTGGASGIGAATAKLFAREGAAVCIVDLDEAGGGRIVREITGAGGRALFVSGDVSLAADCQRAVDLTVEAFGGLDILFNNAGII